MTTKALADFVASVQYDKLSTETVRITKQCILDWLGVCIRGSQEKPIQIIRKLLLDGGGKAQSTVLAGQTEQTTALNAAFVMEALPIHLILMTFIIHLLYIWLQ